ncbi:MAG: DUF1786 family protein [Dehalococcoidia bacterium]|nr:DUF1786 family protein [Dehalococcoidia bacterium]
MKILAMDIGGLTQDILLFDTSQTIENCVQMIMPSPTTILARKIREATKARLPIFFTGVNMGGGPSKRALTEHLKTGFKAFATTEAAATFDDDLEEVARWGVKIISEDEAPKKTDVCIIETRDVDLTAVEEALSAFKVDSGFDAVAIAVLDHGAAPAGVSDRLFRFQHLRQTLEKSRELTAFAYLAEEIPPNLTRMKAVSRSLNRDLPLLVMDTPVAAAIGAGEDREVAQHTHRLIVNVGNFHTLAFHLKGNSILGLFEHHTHGLSSDKLDDLITRLVKGELTNEEVFNDNGHGCVIIETSSTIPFLTVTGPQRQLMIGSGLHPYFAAPYGDMMLTGCFGLVRAFALRVKSWQEEIERALEDSGL